MAKKTESDKQNQSIPISIHQACLELRIVGYYKIHCEKKFSGLQFPLNQWKSKLQIEGVI
jgi:hypothetical protein